VALALGTKTLESLLRLVSVVRLSTLYGNWEDIIHIYSLCISVTKCFFFDNKVSICSWFFLVGGWVLAWRSQFGILWRSSYLKVAFWCLQTMILVVGGRVFLRVEFVDRGGDFPEHRSWVWVISLCRGRVSLLIPSFSWCCVKTSNSTMFIPCWVGRFRPETILYYLLDCVLSFGLIWKCGSIGWLVGRLLHIWAYFYAA
jgi:hypothetical protein